MNYSVLKSHIHYTKYCELVRPNEKKKHVYVYIISYTQKYRLHNIYIGIPYTNNDTVNGSNNSNNLKLYNIGYKNNVLRYVEHR